MAAQVLDKSAGLKEKSRNKNTSTGSMYMLLL